MKKLFKRIRNWFRPEPIVKVTITKVEEKRSYDVAWDSDPKWLKRAFKEIGVKEHENINPKIVEYHSFTSLRAKSDKVPWCSSFVCWCLEMSGIMSTRSAAARSYLHWGYKVLSAERGDIVTLKRGNSPTSGHVGFYLKEDKNYVYLLGGNQSNSVRISRYDKNRIIGIRTINN